MKIREVIVSMVLLLCSTMVFAQAEEVEEPEATKKESERKLVRKGNKAYDNGEFDKAEIKYRQALDVKANMNEGVYNLGNAVYQQERYPEAIDNYKVSAEIAEDPAQKAQAYYNLGNAYLQEKEYEKGIKAYIESLKNDPYDPDTKYNLAYAQLMLKQQMQQQQQQNEENKEENKDENNEQGDNQQNNQDQNGNEEQQANNDQNGEGEQGNEDKKDQNQGQDQGNEDKEGEERQVQAVPVQMTMEEAERLLQQLVNKEEKVQEKMQKHKIKAVEIKTDKDW